jgi:hypothetical protein
VIFGEIFRGIFVGIFRGIFVVIFRGIFGGLLTREAWGDAPRDA